MGSSSTAAKRDGSHGAGKWGKTLKQRKRSNARSICFLFCVLCVVLVFFFFSSTPCVLAASCWGVFMLSVSPPPPHTSFPPSLSLHQDTEYRFYALLLLPEGKRSATYLFVVIGSENIPDGTKSSLIDSSLG